MLAWSGCQWTLTHHIENCELGLPGTLGRSACGYGRDSYQRINSLAACFICLELFDIWRLNVCTSVRAAFPAIPSKKQTSVGIRTHLFQEKPRAQVRAFDHTILQVVMCNKTNAPWSPDTRGQ